MKIIQYKPEYKDKWDSFVRESKNGTFLLCRDFIEYHSDRFTDHSCLFYEDDELFAVLPANISANSFYSHQGLTYGGFILSPEGKTHQLLAMFELLIDYLKANDIKQIIYKPIPHIYHTLPSEEDLYALFRYNAKLYYRNLSCCIDMNNRIKYPRIRKRAIARAINNNLEIEETSDFSSFWKILEENLHTRYSAGPVHNMEEITYLKSKFPNEIHLFQSKIGNEVLGGAVIFETKETVHVQYSSVNEEGRKLGALDIIYDKLLIEYSYKKHFDFGTSNENNGLFLNESLISQKESFGGRGIVYDAYIINLKAEE